jgi:strictosidine synthase
VLAADLPGKADGLAFGPDGRLLAALANGTVVAIDRTHGRWSEIASGGGFLTGLAAGPDGHILAVDERAGALLAAPMGGRLIRLLDRVGDTRLSWTNDVTRAPDGMLYLTTTATGRSLDAFFHEVLEHRGSGLLVRHDPTTGEAHIVAEGLRMTNGIAATPDGRLMVAESAVYGVGLLDSRGNRLGGIEGLPGFTGNIRASDRPGRYWLTLLSPRSALIDGLAPYPLARRLLAWLPESVRPGPVALPCLIEISLEGQSMAARAVRIGGAATSFSTAIEREGQLYLSPAGIVPGSKAQIFVASLTDSAVEQPIQPAQGIPAEEDG